jgi:hypothetical protein
MVGQFLEWKAMKQIHVNQILSNLWLRFEQIQKLQVAAANIPIFGRAQKILI